ncbi:potassium channel family protein [Candidatus Gracilibacteria bacterium]|nr:potassium channel family protein [Candidatus Gracilibacteria bacterium]
MKSSGKKFFSNLLLIEIIVIILVIIIGAVIFHYIEGLHFGDALYFTVTTMSTIGFGDITPQTDLGKIFVSIYAIIGVPLFISVSGLILESRFNRHIKSYVSKFHKELHMAQEEVEALEKKVSHELGDVIQQNEETGEKLDETAQDIKKTKKKIEKIQKTIEDNITNKKPRWKLWKK